MKHKGSKAIAAHIITTARREGVSWTTAEIQAFYGLTEAQCSVVKRRAKQLAAERGFVWAYDPDVNAFVIPQTCAQFSSMLEYGLESWQAEGGCMAYFADGGKAQGYMTRDDAKYLKNEADIVHATIGYLIDDLV